MPRLIDPSTAQTLLGQELGVSRWVHIDQARVNAFAQITDDAQWIHVDVDRATREAGGTIVHGFLCLALMSSMALDIWEVSGAERVYNYGFDCLRFPAPVKVGAHVRLRETLTHIARRDTSLQLTRTSVLEIRGTVKPAVVAEWIALAAFGPTRSPKPSLSTSPR